MHSTSPSFRLFFLWIVIQSRWDKDCIMEESDDVVLTLLTEVYSRGTTPQHEAQEIRRHLKRWPNRNQLGIYLSRLLGEADAIRRHIVTQQDRWNPYPSFLRRHAEAVGIRAQVLRHHQMRNHQAAVSLSTVSDEAAKIRHHVLHSHQIRVPCFLDRNQKDRSRNKEEVTRIQLHCTPTHPTAHIEYTH
ncbi:uncharacterized protein LOC111321028 isoform X3 [Stylophora pistillata]|uniref:uncharacterized protein LOC111321028 isoform X3 n=1 Tax=Stylophora pistillata TaxID=50429 RepID=UPI000C039070|nr:uncharacterized protein LOC111321028 isoform X3 [Stylophora pistillata]